MTKTIDLFYESMRACGMSNKEIAEKLNEIERKHNAEYSGWWCAFNDEATRFEIAPRNDLVKIDQMLLAKINELVERIGSINGVEVLARLPKTSLHRILTRQSSWIKEKNKDAIDALYAKLYHMTDDDVVDMICSNFPSRLVKIDKRLLGVIKKLKARYGTYGEVAKRAGITHQTMSKITTKKNNATICASVYKKIIDTYKEEFENANR